jgi:hypothetical protein
MTYDDLLDAALQDPASADFQELRTAYAQSEDYAPYVHDTEHLEALRAALHGDDLPAALDAIEGLLDHNYLDIEAHMAADYIYTRLNDEENSVYHRTFARGLIDAILDTGSGRDFATAFAVLNVTEEYTVLRVLGFRPAGQRTIQHEGDWFDILSAQHPSRQETFEVYFNIDLPRRWLQDQMADGLDEPSG